MNAPWWKFMGWDQQYLLVKAHKKIRGNIPSLVQFKNIFWARNFLLFVTAVGFIVLSVFDFLLGNKY